MLVSKVKFFLSNETLRNGVFFTLFSFINKGVNFILLLLLARFISPTEYGYWSLFGTIVMFIGYFIAMTTEGYITISYFQEGMAGVKKSFSCILLTTLIVSGILFSITTLLREYLQQISELPWLYLYLAIGIAFFSVYSNIFLNFLRIKKKLALYGIFSCSSAFLVFGLSIILVKYFLMGWHGCIQAQFFSALLFGVIGLCFFLFFCGVGEPSKKHWVAMLCWGVPLIPHLAAQFLRLGCDRYIINYYYSVETVGLFSFAYTLAMAISTIGYGFNEANSVSIYEILGDKKLTSKEKILLLNKQKKSILLVYLCGLTATVVLSIFLVPVFLPKYTSAISYCLILSIFAFFQCVYFLYTNFLFFFKRTNTLMHITFSFAVIHFILSILLTRYSLYITCCIYCFTQLGVVLFVRKNAIEAIKKELKLKVS